MNIDFPDSPELNEAFSAPNGIIYIWDGTKWTLKVDADELLNYWARNALTQQLQPKTFSDKILFSNLGIEGLNSLPS